MFRKHSQLKNLNLSKNLIPVKFKPPHLSLLRVHYSHLTKQETKLEKNKHKLGLCFIALAQHCVLFTENFFFIISFFLAREAKERTKSFLFFWLQRYARRVFGLWFCLNGCVNWFWFWFGLNGCVNWLFSYWR